MARKATARSIRCYHCDHDFEVPSQAVTTSCPSCNKRLVVEDIVVKHAQGNTNLGTCGRLFVAPKAQIVARRIRAIEGADIEGTIESAVETDGAIHLGPKARFKGDCRARVLIIDPGAVILAGFFSIGPNAPPLPGSRAAAASSEVEDVAVPPVPAIRTSSTRAARPNAAGSAASTSSANPTPAASRSVSRPPSAKPRGPDTPASEPPSGAPRPPAPTGSPRARRPGPTTRPR